MAPLSRDEIRKQRPTNAEALLALRACARFYRFVAMESPDPKDRKYFRDKAKDADHWARVLEEEGGF